MLSISFKCPFRSPVSSILTAVLPVFGIVLDFPSEKIKMDEQTSDGFVTRVYVRKREHVMKRGKNAAGQKVRTVQILSKNVPV